MARRPMISRFRLPRTVEEFAHTLAIFIDDQSGACINGTGEGPGGSSFDVDLGEKVPGFNIRIMDAGNVSMIAYPGGPP